jgi:hypothetical protein
MTFVAAGAMTALLMAGTPAYAHDNTYNIPTDFATGYAKVSNGHRTVTACDQSRDGKGVRAWYIDNHNNHKVINDGNGYDSGCGSVTIPSGVGYVTNFRVCLGGAVDSTTGCYPWRTA